ncbi:TPA: TetR/AcrR family transcriptional regulator [Photobacterium damselae]|uniref:Transcriptional regulator TetR family n=5 Tax=Photobacterium damselae TaxID=38293 RepID=D0YXW9_PHODD|nr:TetR/AcrR family transcriptional regulator [Photobacterium damselae]ARR49235.1 TetR family transcriptional regulator [Photobacterium damselae subsp. damselae]AWK81943.1 TetR family transcriptional regulator [Photobacterium damselae]EEZ41100.1 transcriptional regulator TetR family [Photobacterium damselae subsp. damselae CIP 102761]EHA1079385.1 TetR/AcrR family transcriptional regulator [Photobacterium damselae]EJN6960941.1 TetR/AcrR family transcriptional regulator [Photobacterium damselae]
MKTRDRILAVSLDLFNRHGVSQVSTLIIATEMGISPGNLYYHFRGKEEIISTMISDLQHAITQLSAEYPNQVKEFDDYWPFMHTVMALFTHYRFLFRNLDNLNSQDQQMRRKIRSLVLKLRQITTDMINHLIELEKIRCDKQTVPLLADNLLLVSLNWLNYQTLLDDKYSDEELIRTGVLRIISLLEPYLTENAQSPYFTHQDLLNELVI